jgi:hypothetical protein
MHWTDENARRQSGGDEDPSDSLAYDEYEYRCAARHLAVAASELSRQSAAAADVADRYAIAEALFRAQADGMGRIANRVAVRGPCIPLGNGDVVPLTVLLASIYRRERWWLPDRSIDSELVHGAKELLSSFTWSVELLDARPRPLSP